MINNLKKIIIATGGTGGHIFPAYSLAQHFKDKKVDVEIISDYRGFKYLKDIKDIKIIKMNFFSIIRSNFLKLLYSIILIFFSIITSITYLLFNRPNLIFGMGGYSSFPVCIAATLLRIPFIIYESNLLIGKANKFLLPYAKKIFVSHRELEGVQQKFEKKVTEVGNIIRKEVFNFQTKKVNLNQNDSLNILVLGGSQAAEVFGEKLPAIFKLHQESDFKIKIFQQCLPKQNSYLKVFYEKNNIEYEIFNFSSDILKYLLKADVAISRSGSSMSAELINMRVPFISVPLPSSADDHQMKNAIYYNKKGFSYLIEEKDLDSKLLELLKNMSEKNSLLTEIANKQGQYSDKSVYENIDKQIEILINEKY